MKTFFWSTFLFFMIAFSQCFAEPVKLVAPTYPPFLSKDKLDNIGHGLVADIAVEIFKKAGIEYTLNFEPTVRSKDSFLKGRYDFIISSKTVILRQDLSPYGLKPDDIEDINLSNYHAYFFYFKSHFKKPPQFTKLEDLKPYTIGSLKNGSMNTKFAEAGLKYQEAEGPEVNVQKLYLKRIDLWFTIDLTGYYMTKKLYPDAIGDLAYIPNELLKSTLSIMWLKNNKKITPVLKKFNKAFEEAKKDGTIMNIMVKYWGGPPPKEVLLDGME